MLTKEEFHYNFKALKFLTFLNILPLEIDEESGKITRQTKKWRRIVWMAQFGFFILYFCHLIIGLIQTLIHPESYFTPHHYILHFIVLIVRILMIQWQYSAFICRPDNLLAIFNQFFEPRSDLNLGRRSLIDYSYQDLLTFFAPVIFCVAECFVVLLYIFDSSRIQLLHFRFLSEFKNPVTLIFLLFPDIYHITFLLGTADLLLTHQVLFLEKCHVTLQNVQEKIRYFKLRIFLQFLFKLIKSQTMLKFV